ncbi:hypothetical protein D3C83_44280 [compost metagenome]
MADADRAPDQDDQLVDDEGEAEGEEKLVVVAGRIEPAHAGVFDQQAEDRHPQRGNEEGDPEISNEVC